MGGEVFSTDESVAIRVAPWQPDAAHAVVTFPINPTPAIPARARRFWARAFSPNEPNFALTDRRNSSYVD